NFTGLPAKTGISFGSNFGHIYYDKGDGNDTQIVINRPPVAGIASTNYNVNEGSSVVLDGTTTVDPDTDLSTLTFLWDFSDGQGFVSRGATPTFPTSGLDGLVGPNGLVVPVTLKVVDDGG